MQFEAKILTDLTEARTKWLGAGSRQEKVDAAGGLDSSISRLIAVFENYPNLRSVESVNLLMVELEGSENRISVARIDYNNAAKNYNVAIRAFPSNMVASMFGFNEPKPFFSAAPGATAVPSVNLTV